MRAVVYAPNRFDHLLFAMAADAAAPEYVFEFVESTQDLVDTLEAALSIGWLPDLVIVHADGRGGGLDAIRAIDTDPILWPTPSVVVSADVNDDERLRAYAAGASWYQELPGRLSDSIELLEALPDRLLAADDLLDRSGVIDLAAADLIDEIEAFLMDE